MRRGARSVRGRDGPAPTPYVQAQCFDPLVRLCVNCRLLRTPEPGSGKGRPPPLSSGTRGRGRGGSRCGAPTGPGPGRRVEGAVGPAHTAWRSPPVSPSPRPSASPASGPRSLPSVPCPLSPSPPPAPAAGVSSQAPGTALQPQESVGAGARPETVLPLPGLLFGAPALLGLALALALALVALVSWRWQQRRRTASLEAPDGGQDEPLDNVFDPSLGTLNASAPVWPPPRTPEDPGNSTPGHSVPVPATELGSTELVTTKTASPEQQ
uniref:TNF receptor superfamily member 13C n=1 Tax=Sciurus vulgaris TaxID=55149 RepID=A0A8D2DP51_SCIVU